MNVSQRKLTRIVRQVWHAFDLKKIVLEGEVNGLPKTKGTPRYKCPVKFCP